MHAVRAPLRLNATGEIGISKQMWLYAAQFVTYPANHSMAFRGLDVTDKPMQLAITFGRP